MALVVVLEDDGDGYRMMMHMRVRKVVVVGSHGQRDDHGGDRGGDRGGRADATAKVTASSTEWSLRIKPVYICAIAVTVGSSRTYSPSRVPWPN